MDDNLVMEMDQADMVTEELETTLEEVKKPEISAEAGQTKSLRQTYWKRVGNEWKRVSGVGEESRSGWGTSKVANGGSVTISSDSLKDIVPDTKPILENEEPIMETAEGEIASAGSGLSQSSHSMRC